MVPLLSNYQFRSPKSPTNENFVINCYVTLIKISFLSRTKIRNTTARSEQRASVLPLHVHRDALTPVQLGKRRRPCARWLFKSSEAHRERVASFPQAKLPTSKIPKNVFVLAFLNTLKHLDSQVLHWRCAHCVRTKSSSRHEKPLTAIHLHKISYYLTLRGNLGYTAYVYFER